NRIRYNRIFNKVKINTMLNNTLNTLKAATLLVSFTFFSCKTASPESVKTVDSQNQTTISKNLKWSDKMALTLMKRHPESWQIDDAKAPKWDYVHGLVLYSFEQLYKINPDARYTSYVQGYLDALVQTDGTIKTYDIEKQNIEMIVDGRLLFNAYDKTKEEKYLKAMQLLRQQLTEQPRTQSGGFWHKRIYPNQMWLDGLYMGEPFYAQYTVTFENGKNLDDVAHQFEQIQLHATDPKTGLLYHGWDESKAMPWADKETGNSPNFWSRSLGWYAMALVDVLDYFPKDHPKRPQLISYLNRLAKAVTKYQDASGLWFQVTDQGNRDGNYLEASGSSMFAYAFAKGANK